MNERGLEQFLQVLSMDWADYRKGAHKAKTHIGFDLNRGIPRKIFLTSGKGGERPFVDLILAPGENAVSDRGYQSHGDFDQLQAAGKHFVLSMNPGWDSQRWTRKIGQAVKWKICYP